MFKFKSLIVISIVLIPAIFLFYLWDIDGSKTYLKQIIMDSVEEHDFKLKLGSQIPLEPQRQYRETDVEAKINEYRLQSNKTALARYDPLCELAQIRVKEIQTDWSHRGFEERGTAEGDNSLFDRFCNQEDLQCTHIGENLAKGYLFVDELLAGWASSPGHNENMLDDYNVQCVAIGQTYVVSLFAFTQKIEDINAKPVDYSFEAVKFWEERVIEDQKLLDSWESAQDNEFYNQSDVAEVLELFSQKLEIARYLWDGYTNSKITYGTATDNANLYWQLSEQTADLTKKLNEDAYDECVNYWQDAEEEYDQDFDEQIKDCAQYLE